MARMKNQNKGPVVAHLRKKLSSKTTSYKSDTSNQSDQSTAGGSDSRPSRASYSSRRSVDGHSSSSRSPNIARKRYSTSNPSPYRSTARKSISTANKWSHVSRKSVSSSNQTPPQSPRQNTSNSPSPHSARIRTPPHAARKSISSSNRSPLHAARKSISSSNQSPPHAARESISSSNRSPLQEVRRSISNEEPLPRHAARKSFVGANPSSGSESDSDSDAELLRVPIPSIPSIRKTFRSPTGKDEENSFEDESASTSGAKIPRVDQNTSSVPTKKIPPVPAKKTPSVPAKKTPAAVRKTFRKSGYHMRPFSVHITDHRRKPGMLALQQIRYYQKHTGLVIPRRNFQLIFREILSQYAPDYRVQSEALLASQEAAEAHLVHLFETGQLCAIHDNRVTLMNRDFMLIKSIDGK